MKKKLKKIRIFMCKMIMMCTLFLTACSSDKVLFVENSSESAMENTAILEKSQEMSAAQNPAAKESAQNPAAKESAQKTDAEEDLLVSETQDEAAALAAVQTKVTYIVVHVCGAVEHPGVYELKENSRVMDAVTAAGGLSEDADSEYVNLASILADEDKVRIPTKEEVTMLSEGKITESDIGVTNQKSSEITDENTDGSTSDKVNINTADSAQLCTLPGIGQTRAESILAYRREHGSFSKIEDIMQVSGIKESSFQKIKDRITVN
mgnify:CR=1 FL=1